MEKDIENKIQEETKDIIRQFFKVNEEIGRLRTELCHLKRIRENYFDTLRSTIWSRKTMRIEPFARKMYCVLKLRFIEEKNLSEIGKEMGVTRERIRQIEAKSLAILKELAS